MAARGRPAEREQLDPGQEETKVTKVHVKVPVKTNSPEREKSQRQPNFAKQESTNQQETFKYLLSENQEVSEEVFYKKERGVRPIYQDEELQVLMLSVMMCLLLKP